MHRSTAIAFLALACGLLCALLAGCAGPHPFVRDGNSSSVEVYYAGDVATAWPLATEHCARYERVPRLVDAGVDLAIFSCVPK